jgi:hypothetical protein
MLPTPAWLGFVVVTASMQTQRLSVRSAWMRSIVPGRCHHLRRRRPEVSSLAIQNIQHPSLEADDTERLLSWYAFSAEQNVSPAEAIVRGRFEITQVESRHTPIAKANQRIFNPLRSTSLSPSC